MKMQTLLKLKLKMWQFYFSDITNMHLKKWTQQLRCNTHNKYYMLTISESKLKGKITKQLRNWFKLLRNDVNTQQLT